MDEIERAEMHEEKYREAAVSKRKKIERHHGYCLNCREPSANPFCNRDCREDYERFEGGTKRNGE